MLFQFGQRAMVNLVDPSLTAPNNMALSRDWKLRKLWPLLEWAPQLPPISIRVTSLVTRAGTIHCQYGDAKGQMTQMPALPRCEEIARVCAVLIHQMENALRKQRRCDLPSKSTMFDSVDTGYRHTVG